MSNVLLNVGAGGATLGTDQVAGSPNVDYQIVKIGFSAAGSAPVQVQTGNPLPTVQTGAIPAGGNLIGAVNLQIAGTAVSVNSGNLDAGTIRVVLATNSPSLTNAIPVSQSGAPWSVSGSGTFTTADNHFPASAALSDALANPTTTLLGANLLGWDATNTVWRRVQVTSATGKLLVDGSTVTQPISAASLPLPTGASTSAKQPALGVAGTPSTDVLTIQGAATMTKLLVTPDSVALPANQSVNLNQAAGTALDVNSGNKSAGTIRVVLATDQPSMTNAQPVSQSGSPWGVNDAPVTSGGLSRNYQIAPATPAKTVVKGSAGQLYAIKGSNNNATPVYVKLFDAVTGSVTLGTTACDDQFEIPGNTAGAGFVYNVDKGMAYATGIIAAITSGLASTDNTAIAANSVIVTLYFK